MRLSVNVSNDFHFTSGPFVDIDSSNCPVCDGRIPTPVPPGLRTTFVISSFFIRSSVSAGLCVFFSSALGAAVFEVAPELPLSSFFVPLATMYDKPVTLTTEAAKATWSVESMILSTDFTSVGFANVSTALWTTASLDATDSSAAPATSITVLFSAGLAVCNLAFDGASCTTSCARAPCGAAEMPTNMADKYATALLATNFDKGF